MLNHGEPVGSSGGAATVATPAPSPPPDTPVSSLLDVDDAPPPPNIRAREAPRLDRRSHTQVVRARCLAAGGLAAMAAAVGIITATTLDTPRPPAPVAAQMIVGRPRYWIAGPGQSLISIAARESASPSAVERANPSLVGHTLTPGQRVRLPH